MKTSKVSYAIAASALCLMSAQAMAVGFELLPASGSQTLIECQGVQEPQPQNGPPGQCLVASLGTATMGYSLQSTNTSTIYVNSYNVGQIEDRVYSDGSGSYILALKLTINGNGSYVLPGETETEYFEVNDLFREGYSGVGNVSVAYTPPSELNGIAGLWLSGYTLQGINEYPGSPYGLSPDRSGSNDPNIPLNDWIDFRTDVSGYDPDGDSRDESSWFLLEFSASGVSSSPVASTIQARQGGEEDQPPLEVSVPGYKPSSS